MPTKWLRPMAQVQGLAIDARPLQAAVWSCYGQVQSQWMAVAQEFSTRINVQRLEAERDEAVQWLGFARDGKL